MENLLVHTNRYSIDKNTVVIYDTYTYARAEITVEQFKRLMQRASRHTEKEPPEVMEFLDIAVHGTPQQDYKSMEVYRNQSHDTRANRSDT